VRDNESVSAAAMSVIVVFWTVEEIGVPLMTGLPAGSE
jgi:hypothetical protein